MGIQPDATSSMTNGASNPWFEAARPRTLPLAVAGVGLGLFLAAADGPLRWGVALLTVVTAMLLQILSNLANDYGDSRHGADSTHRVGPARAVQSGKISAPAMRRAIAIVAGLTLLSGLALVWLALGSDALFLTVVFLALGIAAVWAAIAYTASNRPYGYAGLGDLFVFLFFGLVAVGGSFFLQTLRVDLAILLPATSVGLLAVGVLNINNIRDMDSDREARKFTVPVRFGRRRALTYHGFLLAGAFIAALTYVLLTYRSPWQFLFLVATPLLIGNGAAVSGARTPQALDPLLRQLSLSTLVFVLTFGMGMLAA